MPGTGFRNRRIHFVFFVFFVVKIRIAVPPVIGPDFPIWFFWKLELDFIFIIRYISENNFAGRGAFSENWPRMTHKTVCVSVPSVFMRSVAGCLLFWECSYFTFLQTIWKIVLLFCEWKMPTDFVAYACVEDKKRIPVPWACRREHKIHQNQEYI